MSARRTPIQRVDRAMELLVEALRHHELEHGPNSDAPLARAYAELLELRGALARQERDVVAMVAGAPLSPARRSA